MLKIKFTLSDMAIAVVVLTALVIVFDLKNWEKEERVIEHDIHHYYAYLPALFIYDDIKLEKSDYRYGENRYYFWYTVTDAGGKVIKMSTGTAILYAPFFFAAHIYAICSGYPATGFSEPYKLFLLISSIFYLIIGLDFLRKILLYFSLSHKVVAITILLVGAGTNLLCYASQSAPMSHVYSFCLVAMFIYFTIKWHEGRSIKNTLAVGFLFGLISLIRPSNIVIFLFFLLYDVGSIPDLKRKIKLFKKSLHLFILIFFTFFLVWVPQFIYWKTVTGDFLFYSYTDEHFFFNDPKIIEGLFSFRKGWLIYTPIMIFSLIGIFLKNDTLQKLRPAILTFFLINIYIIFSWWCWWYGGTFGQRSMIDSYAVLAVPLSFFVKYILERKAYVRYIVFSFFAFLIWLNVFQTYQFEYQSLHHDGMTKELYFKQFGKLDRIPDFDKYVNWPDYESAKKPKQKNVLNGNIEIGRKIIQLKSVNDKFICADGATDNRVVADKEVGSTWETFTLIYLSENKCVIQAYNNMFLTIDLNKQNRVAATKENVGENEIFTIMPVEGSFYAFKANNNKYLTVDKESFQLFAKAEGIGKYEKFELLFQ